MNDQVYLQAGTWRATAGPGARSCWTHQLSTGHERWQSSAACGAGQVSGFAVNVGGQTLVQSASAELVGRPLSSPSNVRSHPRSKRSSSRTCRTRDSYQRAVYKRLHRSRHSLAPSPNRSLVPRSLRTWRVVHGVRSQGRGRVVRRRLSREASRVRRCRWSVSAVLDGSIRSESQCRTYGCSTGQTSRRSIPTTKRCAWCPALRPRGRGGRGGPRRRR